MTIHDKIVHFAEHYGNGFFVHSLAEKKTIYLNKTAQKLFDMTPETCDFTKIFSPDIQGDWEDIIQGYQKKHQGLFTDCYVLDKEGFPLNVDIQIGDFDETGTEIYIEMIPRKDLSKVLAQGQVDKSLRPEGILELDEGLSLYHHNSYFLELFGLTDSFAHYDNQFMMVIPEPQREGLRQDIQTALTETGYLQRDIQALHSQGGTLWLSLDLQQRQVEESGAPKAMITLRNIGFRKELESKNHIMEQQFQAMQEMTEDILYHIHMDTGLLYHNVNMVRLEGQQSPLEDYVTTFITQEVIHPEDAQKFVAFLQDWYFDQATEGECTLRGSLVTMEYQWYTIRNKKIFDDEGNLAYVIGALVNVQKEYTMEQEYTNLNQYYQAVQSLSEESLYTVDIKTRTLHSQGIILKELGLPQELEDYPKSVYHIVHKEDLENYKSFVDHTLQGTDSTLTLQLQTKDRQYQWYELHSTVIRDEGGNPREILGKIKNIQQQKDLETKASIDLMTKVLNKVSFEEAVAQVLDQSQEGENHALIFIDLDDFKGVNDNLGHGFGDFLLTTVGKRLKRVVRETDLIGRLGGDEFAVFLRGIYSIEACTLRVKLLLETLQRNFSFDGKSAEIKASLGVAIYPHHGRSYKELIEKSDLALYASKAKGKNVATVYDPEIEEY